MVKPRSVQRRTREPVKAWELLTKLKDQIVEGTYPPGSRLPTRDQLQAQHKVSGITVQRALDQLGSEQFIQAHTRRGTFVVDDPPHLTQFAIVFNQRSTDRLWSQFDLALSNEAAGVGKARNKQINSFYGVVPHEDNEDFAALCRRATGRAIAGLIFSDDPNMFLDTPLMDAPGIPRVVLAPGTVREGTPSVAVDHDDWIDKALNFLVARGHKKIAFISRLWFALDKSGRFNERYMAGLRQRGLETRPYWIHAPALEFPASMSNVVHLLMRQTGVDRPDALVIDDDHYVEMATTGLLAAGVQPDDRFRVIAHSNFPWPTRSVVPVTRLGFDVRNLLHTCMDLLDRQRQGETTPRLTKIPAVFEEELNPPLP